jgi:hypothetical protein
MTAIAPGSAADPPAGDSSAKAKKSKSSRPGREGPRGPLTLLLDFFSSVRLGIALMIIIFIYSSIGSAGLPVHWNIIEPSSWSNVRELIEMSEFQWFHWWPFDLMIALFCINITTVTIRRIPFNVMNLGVWMIHTGLVVLAIGSVIYFTLKQEGDAPIPRREVVIEVPGREPVTMVASPGNELVVGEGADAWRFRVASITPDWELLSGDDAGTRAYKVTMSVESPERAYLRELIDGFPQYTEDLVRSTEGGQPFARAINTIGRKLVDDSVQLGLRPVEVDHFYLMETRAIYLRELGSREWIERPVPWMPMFRDHVRSLDDVWTMPGDYDVDPIRPVTVKVPAVDPNDPLPDVDFTVVDYLRYAVMQERRLPGGDTLNPALTVRLTSRDGTAQSFELAAFDEERSTALRGALAFHWAADEAEAEQWLQPTPPAMVVRRPDGTTDEFTIDRTAQMDPNLAFRPVPGTDYSWRVDAFEDNLDFQGRLLSVAIVEIRQGGRTFTRWVFDDPALTRDVPDGESIAQHSAGTVDEGIDLTFRPGTPVAIRLVAGPEEDRLRISVPQPSGGVPQSFELQPRQSVVMPGDLQLVVDRFASRTQVVERPLVIPKKQRDRDVGMMASMIRLKAPVGGTLDGGPGDEAPGDGVWEGWMPYHLYAFDSPSDTIRRFRYDPSVMQLPDGRRIEMKFSRQRAPLDEAVRLESFEVVARIGGFQGDTSSIRDWKSIVSFEESDGEWTDTVKVHMNQPKSAGQFWFFQAQWDPPDQPRFDGDPGSAGLNYTVLGVGNRHGVNTQLIGTIITVIGLMYAFYVKPWMRRRQLVAAYVAAGLRPDEAKAAAATGDTPEKVAAAMSGSAADASSDTREPATAGEERS